MGKSGNPQKHIKDSRKLEFAHPVTWVKDMNQAERDIHNELSSYKSQLGGGMEWYTLCHMTKTRGFWKPIHEH